MAPPPPEPESSDSLAPQGFYPQWAVQQAGNDVLNCATDRYCTLLPDASPSGSTGASSDRPSDMLKGMM